MLVPYHYDLTYSCSVSVQGICTFDEDQITPVPEGESYDGAWFLLTDCNRYTFMLIH